MFNSPLVLLTLSPGTITADRVGEGRSATVFSEALSHPRTLMGGFEAVVQAMKEAMAKLDVRTDGGMLKQLASVLSFGASDRVGPSVLIQLPAQVAGGYTDVELRAFKEAGLIAGAARVGVIAQATPVTALDVSAVKQALGRSLV